MNMSESGDGDNGSGPVSRSSVTHVAYIVQKFDDVKKDLVRQIGFGGILDLPLITKVDRKFTLWLLSKVDTAKRCIVVNDQCVADLIDFEVTRIIAIPCGRSGVCSLDQGDKKKKLEFYQKFISTTDSDCNSLTAVENNVKAEYDVPMQMTKKDKDNFKVSFVVWVMGHLLAPTKKHNVGSDRFWGALVAPDEINQFNWAAYVIDELITAAVDVQNCIKNNKNVSTITGCAILLQIIYFEAINMGSLNRPRGISPRVKVYDGKSLSLMIAADKASSLTKSGSATWGSYVRRLPQERNETLHPSSETYNNVLKTDTTSENDIILDLGKYLREKFGDKLSSKQSVAFNWFHARCSQHLKHLRLSIQQDSTELVGKLLRTSDVAIPAVLSEPNHSSAKASRPAYSELSRPPTYIRSILKNKRGYESSSICKIRSTKKHNVTFSTHTLPDTLLPGMFASVQHELQDKESDSGYHSKSASHNSALSSQADIPSFDLGIEFNTEGNDDAALLTANSVLIGKKLMNKQNLCISLLMAFDLSD